MNAESGFTLIEVLAAGLISTLVAGAILSVLYMSTGQIRDGAALSGLSQNQAVVSEQIRSSARKAFGAWTTGEVCPMAGNFDAAEAQTFAYPGSPQVKEVAFCNPVPFGTILSGYKIDEDGMLWERVGLDLKPFRIGVDTVKIVYDSSYFTILPKRRGITFTIKFRRDSGGKSYYYPLIRETVLSRNRRYSAP